MKVFAVISLAAALAQAGDILPQLPDKSRYAGTVARSPFVLETKAAEEPSAPVDSPFKGLYLLGVSKEGDKDWVVVQSRDAQKAMHFVGNEPGEEGLAVKTVRIGNSFRETKVVLQKGAETGEIGYREEVNTPPPAVQQKQMPGMPPTFSRPGMPTVPGAMPGSTRTVPAVAPPIPRPQVPVAVPLPNPTMNVQQQQQQQANDANRRQRVRVINQ
jgi:hypothetical protein